MFVLSKVTIEGDVNGVGEVNTRDPETAVLQCRSYYSKTLSQLLPVRNYFLFTIRVRRDRHILSEPFFSTVTN